MRPPRPSIFDWTPLPPVLAGDVLITRDPREDPLGGLLLRRGSWVTVDDSNGKVTVFRGTCRVKIRALCMLSISSDIFFPQRQM